MRPRLVAASAAGGECGLPVRRAAVGLRQAARAERADSGVARGAWNGVMESIRDTVSARQLRFCRGAGTHRLAYSVVGQGPTMVVPPGWVSHQELMWSDPDFSGFYGALAAHHRVVTYDKHGTGLSDRDRTDLSLDADVADLERLVDEVAGDRFVLFSSSMGGPLAVAYAARHPDRVSHLIVHGGFARGEAVSPERVRGSLLSLVRAHWGLGSRLLAVVFIPDDRDGGIDRWCRFQRESASPEMAADVLESFFEIDVSALLPEVRVPTLITHRRRDHAIPLRAGRELAAGIPGARLVTLDGDIHMPWLGDGTPILRAIEEFVADAPAAVVAAVDRRPSPSPPPEPSAPRAAPSRTYRLVYLEPTPPDESTAAAPVRGTARIGLAQIDVPLAWYGVRGEGMLGLGREHLGAVQQRLRRMAERAEQGGVDLLVFPELSLDLGFEELSDEVVDIAAQTGMIIVPGAFHDPASGTSVARVVGPSGVLWEQEKHIPAIVMMDGRRVTERIASRQPGRVVLASTPVGRIAVTVCRDFLDLDLRVELKNHVPPVDIVVNPACTPVTADFEAAHFESRRSIYAYCVFCNMGTFGHSLVYSPERHEAGRQLAPGEEDLLVKEVDLFGLRAARRHWEEIRRHEHGFIQSTR